MILNEVLNRLQFSIYTKPPQAVKIYIAARNRCVAFKRRHKQCYSIALELIISIAYHLIGDLCDRITRQLAPR